jgi:hypothetical protein
MRLALAEIFVALYALHNFSVVSESVEELIPKKTEVNEARGNILNEY